MLKIGDNVYQKGETLDETLKFIKEFMKENGVLLMNQEQSILSEEEIVERLESDVAVFEIKKVKDLETETLADACSYFQFASVRLQEIIKSEDQELLYVSITDVIESLMYFSKVAQYFSIGDISEEYVQTLAEKIVNQMEVENVDYLKDVLEFEILPLVEQLRDSFEKRVLT